ncbi:autotransporter domain-containing protein [Herminiimonas arsenitoxidans]|uniref:autotransporter domain-containing protein n=1 Tax=Herminiimonas arsenitoxidans TaxID=1809410 RepID=UPI000970A28B|nr:autotransporter domain-containing protein [Herminiimonas arsenitoxidans]
MNKAYRIVWSKARSAFIVTHEKSASRGKSSTTCAAATLGVAALLLSAGPSLAANVCTAVTNSISGIQATDSNCVLNNNGSSVTIEEGAVISAIDTTIKPISVSGAVGSITNNGTVSAAGIVAIDIASGSTLSGNITNTGTLSASNTGAVIRMKNTSIAGAIINDGSSAQMTGSVYLDGSSVKTIQNINGAQINALDANANGIDLRNSSKVTNGILNGASSSIVAHSAAINVDNSTIGTGGIVNHGTLTGGLQGVQLVQFTVNDNVVNTGKINATGPVSSWGFYSVLGTVNGSLRNEGVNSEISANTGITLAMNSNITGGLFNEGKIQGNDAYAIYLRNSSKLGGIVNSGSIISTGIGSGIEVTTTSAITNGIHNTGTISSKYAALALGGGATLTAGTNGTALYNNNKILTNYGSAILVTGAGSKITGNIVNDTSGIIGIAVNGNSGTAITVDSQGQIDGGIYNSGTIIGYKYAVQVSANASLAAIYAQGSNARFIGDVDASNTDFTVSAGANFSNTNAYKVKGFSVANGAQFTMTAGNSLSGGALSNGITVGSNGFNNAGAMNLAAGTTAVINGTYTQAGTGVLQVGSNGSPKAKLTIQGVATNTGSIGLATNAEFVTTSLSSSGTVTLANGALLSTTNGFRNDGTLSLSGANATVQGNYTQTNTGVLRVGVSGDTTYTKLNINGVADLGSNAKIDVDVSPRDYKFSVDRLQNVLTASTLNSDGTFAVTDNSILFDFGAIKVGNAIHLTLAKAPVTVLGSVKETNNTPAVGAATVLDQVITANPGGAIGSHFVGLTSKQAVSDAVSQTLPLLNGGSMAAATGSITSINRVVQARIENNRGLSSGDDMLGDKYVWFKPFGSWARQDDRDGQSGFKANSTGFVAGADMAANERSRLGVGFAYAKSKVDGNSAIAPQHMDVDVFQLLGYGSYSLDENTEINFQADVGQNSNKGSRRIAFTGSTASASYKSLTAHVGVGVGRILPLNANTSFTPSVRADYTWIKDQSYQENGAGALNLNVAGRSANELLLAVDGKLAHKLNEKTTFVANLGTAYTAVKGNTSIIAAFAGAPQAAFATYGMEQRPWTVRGGLGLVRKTGNGSEIALRYDAEGRNGFVNQTASVKARWMF